MKVTALGAIETFGLVPAIEAADTAVKSAQVTLSGKQQTGAGLVTVLIRGDISAVKASVDAGKAAAQKLGKVISTTVIGRTAEGLDTILVEQDGGHPGNGSGRTGEQAPSEAMLRKMTVTRLRRLARSLDAPFSIERKNIKFALKKDLIRAILDHYRQI